jgi:hypothetical protein
MTTDANANDDCAEYACESGEHVEAGNRRLPRRYPGRLVRPTADTAHHSSSHAHYSRKSSVQMQITFTSLSKRTKRSLMSLISSLEADVISCLGGDRVPDYCITQLAKVLQQGSQPLLNESDDDEYPPTLTSLTIPDAKPAARGDKADGERMDSTAPTRGVSRERFSYWYLDLLFPHLF